jgi:integrase
VGDARRSGAKNAESHRVWLPKSARAIIDSNETTGFVFGSRRPVTGLDVIMRTISKEIGVDPVRPHDLRRTFCSKVNALGFGRPAMDRIANHRNKSVTDVYDRHAYQTEDQHIMESVAAHILALAEGKPEESNVVQLEARR